jgi:ribose transport system permease protein
MTIEAEASPLSPPGSGTAVRRRVSARHLRGILPFATFVLLLAAILLVNPRTQSYFGISLMFSLAPALVLATLGQMSVIAARGIDLSTGAFVSLAACVAATWLPDRPLLAILVFAGMALGQAALGALIAWRNMPSIVITLGMSFVWQGLAVTLLPTAVGSAPAWLKGAITFQPPFVPMSVILVAVAAIVMHFVMTSSFGAVLRGVGANERALERAGWPTVALHAALYGLSGILYVLAGIGLVGVTTSADANIVAHYTLLTIAAVILGGGEFTGGRVSAVGAVFGALTLTLAAVLLAFLRVSSDWQIGAQGLILLGVLAARVLISRNGRGDLVAPTLALPEAKQRIPSFVWSYIAAVAILIAMLPLTSGAGALGLVSAALGFTVFMALAGLAQMFVITSGPGNIDLSIPVVIVLAGQIGLLVMGGSDAMIVPGLLAGLAAGIVVGVVNAWLIQLLAIPPIIATLCVSLVVQSVAIVIAHRGVISPPPFLAFATTYRIGPMPVMTIAVILLSVVLALLLHRTVYGRNLQALGQNARAAWLMGVAVNRTRLATYCLSGGLAALCGMLLSSFSGGASLDIGADYLLTSIAVVAIGGTNIAGGRGNVSGIWGAALFLYLMIAMLNSLQFGPGPRLALSGLVILTITIVASSSRALRN